MKPTETITRAQVLASAANVGTRGRPRYMIIDDKVYDVSDFSAVHPGGVIILTQIGRDATDVFTTFHPRFCDEILADYYVCDLDDEDKEKPRILASDSANTSPMRSHQTDQKLDYLPPAEKQKPASSLSFRQGMLLLRSEFEKQGLFNSDWRFFASQAAIILALCGSAFYILLRQAETTPSLFMVVLSAVMLAFGWQQSGWLSHDFLHHSVFHDYSRGRAWNRRLALFFGNFVQGFSCMWWMFRHNLHHSAPNVYDVDLDIATMPIFAWCREDAAKWADSASEPGLVKRAFRVFVSNQARLVAVVFSGARLSWALQSIVFAATCLWKALVPSKNTTTPSTNQKTKTENSVTSGATEIKETETKLNDYVNSLDFIKVADIGSPVEQLSKLPDMKRHAGLECALLGLHWAFYAFFLSRLPMAYGIMHFVISELVCGLLLASVFSLNHSGRDIIALKSVEEMDFFSLQVRTARDLKSNWFTNWFCGGLNFQIEHHLFPTMPRHNFPNIQPIIQKMCLEHEIPHHTTTFFAGLREVVDCLRDISVVAKIMHYKKQLDFSAKNMEKIKAE